VQNIISIKFSIQSSFNLDSHLPYNITISFITPMDDNEIFEDCLEEQLTTDTVSPLDELKEWIKNHGKFPKNIRKFNLGH
jgi:hypothetical protein